MEIQKTIDSLTIIELKVLPILKNINSFEQIIKLSKLSEVEVMRALQWLKNKNTIKLSEQKKEFIELDENGKKYLQKGLPERVFLNSIKSKSLTLSKIKNKTGMDDNEINISVGILRKKAAINVKKEKEIIISITEQGKKLLKKDSLEEQFLKKKFPLELSDLKPEEK